VHAPPGPIARALWLMVDLVRPPVVIEGEAELCDDGHAPFIAFGDGPTIALPGSPHVDVNAKAFNRGQQVVTVIGVKKASAAGQQLAPDETQPFEDVTLAPGGERKTLRFTLSPVDKIPLAASEGDELILTLRLTRGPRAPRARFRL
jgi:hypothetical protein